MAIILFQKPDLSCFSRNHQSPRRPTFVSPRMNLNFPSPQSRTKQGVDVELQTSLTPHHIQTSEPSDIQFDRLQPSDQDCDETHKTEFGKFIAREVVVDEEYWQAAAWLRAETHWEDLPFDRYTNTFKRKFADQHFNELKRRGSGQHIHMSSCIVAVKKQDKNVKKRTVLQSVVGTLDLSIRYLLQGETFPGERVKAPIFSGINKTSPHRYAYVANLCVSKSARRQGIATNMLNFSIKSAKAKGKMMMSNFLGVQQVFVQVYTANAAARELYLKMGFQIVEAATPHLLAEDKYLMCINT